MLMIVSDLSCTMKPWPIHVKHVKCLVEEFMQQGDYEKNLELTPLAMMDRDCMYLLPQVEVIINKWNAAARNPIDEIRVRFSRWISYKM